MALTDLTLGMKNLNSFGRLVCSAGLVGHAAIAYAFPYIMLVLVGSYAVTIYSIYHFAYQGNFLCATRFERMDEDCPSNSLSPKFESSIDERTKELLPGRRQSLKHLGDSGEDEDLLTPAENEHKRRSAPRLTLNVDAGDVKVRLQDRQGSLDMNHVKMSWFQFLNCYFMIVPSAFLLQLIGFAKMTSRKWLHRRGLVQPKPVDYEAEVSKLCLETMQAIHFAGFKDEEETVAIFTWSEFPYVVDAEVTSGDIDHADLFVIDIDLTSQPKRMIKAMLDDRELTASETYILLNYEIIAHNHTKIHALANWGLHTGNADSFVRWNSCVTVMYNYFGMTTYTQITAFWKALGLLNYDYDVITQFFQAGTDEGIPPHDNIRKLVKHSALVKFIVGTRNIFLNEFQDYRAEFMGIDGEAMFVGTIIHGIDHTMYTTLIQDVLWVDHTHPEFGFMAECVQMVFEGFSKDLPLLPFNRRYKNATHPFYKAVYEGAKQLNPWFADRMDTCIIK